eukprot:TRINITY_DN28980_c0_g1_i1.p1 TRINITY_DN28980_c0_g1~~TRINITY_DN28980_c0_g1_i1.p1  ORF type:complete len:144 (-),score=30.46 TRINITY_DN28980_c0_g1_i1:311-742(-)
MMNGSGPCSPKILSNVAVQTYTGPGQFPDFITRLVDNCLTMKGQDPETFFDGNVDRNLLSKKLKNRGKHNESRMETDEKDTNDTSAKGDFTVMQLDDEDDLFTESRDGIIHAYESFESVPKEIKKNRLKYSKWRQVPGYLSMS